MQGSDSLIMGKVSNGHTIKLCLFSRKCSVNFSKNTQSVAAIRRVLTFNTNVIEGQGATL
jgi:hypothetical protein